MLLFNHKKLWTKFWPCGFSYITMAVHVVLLAGMVVWILL